jgi:hypothetical protein
LDINRGFSVESPANETAKNENPPTRVRELFVRERFSSDFHDIRSLKSFRALLYFELDGITFLQAFVAIAHDRFEVDKDIFSTTSLDEAESFCSVEPLDGSAFHWEAP